MLFYDSVCLESLWKIYKILNIAVVKKRGCYFGKVITTLNENGVVGYDE